MSLNSYNERTRARPSEMHVLLFPHQTPRRHRLPGLPAARRLPEIAAYRTENERKGSVGARSLSLDETRAHQRVDVRPLDLSSARAIHLLQQHRKNLHRRLQAQDIGALPALQPRDSDTRL
jgi:hypothetical protein